jgi:ribosomal-protein-alanine N-acetyltransferase
MSPPAPLRVTVPPPESAALRAVQTRAGGFGAAAAQPPEGGRTLWPGTAGSTGAPAETRTAAVSLGNVAQSDGLVGAATERRVAFEPMTELDLDAVCEVEQSAYAHPWSRKHFADSLVAGYPAVMLLGEPRPGEQALPCRPDGRLLLGYLVAMHGVDEMHLLNITVAPAHQRQGWARCLLDALCLWSRGLRAQWLWLEVRASNAPARALYAGYGFRPVGVRKGYYPAGAGPREDAVVMSLDLSAAATEAGTP